MRRLGRFQLILATVFSLCIHGSLKADEPQVRGSQVGPSILLNHLYSSVDPVTYQAIVESEFLRTQFAVSETRTTIRNDYPDGYTGVYFYGNETYFEFFDSASSAFPIGNFGVATGYEKDGEFESARQALDSVDGAIVSPVERHVGSTAVPWFVLLYGAAESGYGGPSVWGMQYSEVFIDGWLGSHSDLDGSILQRDILRSYAIKLEQTELQQTALMKDVTFVDAALDPQFLAAYSEQFGALGWIVEQDNACDLLISRNSEVRLCPATEQRGVGIHQIDFSLTRSHDGPIEMKFGNSTMTFDDQAARWHFSFPKPSEASGKK